MANFYGHEFSFDGIPSHNFDLKIITFEDGGIFNSMASTDVEIVTQRVLRKSRPYFLGRITQPVLEFPLTFGRAKPISGLERDLISRWLFGRSTYKKLEILQDDLNSVYFNVFLKEPEIIYIGNLSYAFTCTVVCDSPFAYGYPLSKTMTTSGNTINYFEIYNNSSEDDYLYPTVSFSVTSSPDFFYIKNITDDPDNERPFQFSNLLTNQSITVDNDKQIITSTSHPLVNMLPNFNKKWFRLVPKINGLVIQASNGCSCTVSWTEKFKVGG